MYVAATVAMLHFIGSIWFFETKYDTWIWGFIGVSPQGPDPTTTKWIMLYEFPMFLLHHQFGVTLWWSMHFLVLASANAIIWGTFVLAVSRVVRVSVRWLNSLGQ